VELFKPEGRVDVLVEADVHEANDGVSQES